MNRRKALLVSSLALVGAAVVAAAILGRRATAQPSDRDPVARGRYLVTTMMCNDCHTPWHLAANGPEPDMRRMLSGHPAAATIAQAPAALKAPWVAMASETNTAWAGPWGVSFTANLTPDKETGLGTWTAEMFRTALRTGRHLGRGRPILPPMPWPFIGQLDDADLDAMFAYLQSIPAITNRVPEPLPPSDAPAPEVGAAPASAK